MESVERPFRENRSDKFRIAEAGRFSAKVLNFCISAFQPSIEEIPDVSPHSVMDSVSIKVPHFDI